MTVDEQMLAKVRDAEGFIAALDQSGGSTPKALLLYGIQENEYSGDAEMFDQIHQMRTRIITSPAFNGDRILGAILFEMTMDRQIECLSIACKASAWDTPIITEAIATSKLKQISKGNLK